MQCPNQSCPLACCAYALSAKVPFQAAMSLSCWDDVVLFISPDVTLEGHLSWPVVPQYHYSILQFSLNVTSEALEPFWLVKLLTPVDICSVHLPFWFGHPLSFLPHVFCPKRALSFPVVALSAHQFHAAFLSQ